ncbi:MAG: O-antigen ligase family protein, partial [Firmicutes bacterium]|nr:O-antigen ligase family protein [Bacillota bacterium]
MIHIDLYPIYLPVQGREQNPPLLEWGILALLVITLAWVVVLKRPAAVSNSYLFKVGVFGVTLLYLSDPLLSTLDPYFFTHRFWPLWMLLTFYLVYLLGDNARWRSIMVDYMVFLVGVQATYAVVFHVLGVNQFYTPNFGARTQGTYINPNTLYPVMLWGGALAFARYAWEPTRALKWFHLACLCLCLLAIWLTYTRSAWLAVGAMCAVLLAAHRKQISKANMAAILLVMALFLLGTLFVRTKGHLMGNPEDRSAWGRLQIWRTAFAIYQQHPVIGHGVMSYRYWQNRFVTPELEQFGPLNVEAKNLFLNFAVEFGTIGVAVLIFSLWHVLRLCGHLLRHELGHEDRAIVLGCYLATIGTIVAGLFDTPVFEPWRLPSSVLMMGTWGLLPGIADKIPSATPVPHFGFSRFARGVMIAVAVGILLLGMWVVVPAFVIFKASRQVLLEKVQSGAVKTPTRNGAFVPPYVKDLFIASEDGYFYQHRGVDWQALHRALRVNIRNLAFKQGGSTITMQTARYLFVGRE